MGIRGSFYSIIKAAIICVEARMEPGYRRGGDTCLCVCPNAHRYLGTNLLTMLSTKFGFDQPHHSAQISAPRASPYWCSDQGGRAIV